MLHISISAALYRPLAIHVLITNEHKEIVNLQEATQETIQEQELLLVNKETNEHQKHLRKLQSHCHHGHHHHQYDPDDMVAKLQVKYILLELD